MKQFPAMFAAMSLAMAAFAGDAPVMMAPTDMKWTDVPERKGMQFALLTGAYTQMRKLPPAPITAPLPQH